MIVKREPWILVALPIAIISLLLILIINPFLGVRVGFLRCDRLGHFAANTELYLCYKDGLESKKKIIDIFYYPREVCNYQLATMWERELFILPWFWMRPIDLIIRSFDCLAFLRVVEARGEDRDVDSLFDETEPHLSFTSDEDNFGREQLEKFGIPKNANFVCITVRDNAYLKDFLPENSTAEYHNYRDCDVQNFILAAEDLAERGYYVLRMGAKVNNSIKSKHPKVIDYAVNGMRTDFMDVWLGANCDFCISTATGFDAIPYVFRRPIVYVNNTPVGYLFTFSKKSVAITKHHMFQDTEKEMTLSEIFEHNVGYSLEAEDYINNGVFLIENTPEEIRDVVLEMDSRLHQSWKALPGDRDLQDRFQSIYNSFVSQSKIQLHGKIKFKYGASFLRENRAWLN